MAHALSPHHVSQASCDSPYNSSEFTNPSPSSAFSGGLSDDAAMSPDTLQDLYGQTSFVPLHNHQTGGGGSGGNITATALLAHSPESIDGSASPVVHATGSAASVVSYHCLPPGEGLALSAAVLPSASAAGTKRSGGRGSEASSALYGLADLGGAVNGLALQQRVSVTTSGELADKMDVFTLLSSECIPGLISTSNNNNSSKILRAIKTEPESPPSPTPGPSSPESAMVGVPAPISPSITTPARSMNALSASLIGIKREQGALSPTQLGLKRQHDPLPSALDDIKREPTSPSRVGIKRERDVFEMDVKNNAQLMPSATVDTTSTATPYSDATQPKKQAKEGYVRRPMNAFMVWSQQQRRQITAERPDMHNADISKRLGAVWKQLPDSTKQKYVKEAQRLRELHRLEFPSYKYQPRKKPKQEPGEPVKTESGRISKPKNRDNEKKTTAKTPRGGGGGGAKNGSSRRGKNSGGKNAKSAAASVSQTQPVSAEVNNSLMSLLQTGPLSRGSGSRSAVVAQIVGGGSECVSESSNNSREKMYSRLVIDANFRRCVQNSQTVPSSLEVRCLPLVPLFCLL